MALTVSLLVSSCVLDDDVLHVGRGIHVLLVGALVHGRHRVLLVDLSHLVLLVGHVHHVLIVGAPVYGGPSGWDLLLLVVRENSRCWIQSVHLRYLPLHSLGIALVPPVGLVLIHPPQHLPD
jgi:hypothetical protein